jgi:mitogen-activated protein kinase 1/3
MLSCRTYTAAVDVWAAGCILGEMLARKPMFTGNDYVHQLKLIVKCVGTPGSDDLWFVTNAKARKFVTSLPVYDPVDLKTLCVCLAAAAAADIPSPLPLPRPSSPSLPLPRYPDANGAALDLLRRMLVVDPARRISVGAALDHAFLSSVRDLDAEGEAQVPIQWRDLETMSLTKGALQRELVADIECFRPDVAAALSAELRAP